MLRVSVASGSRAARVDQECWRRHDIVSCGKTRRAAICPPPPNNKLKRQHTRADAQDHVRVRRLPGVDRLHCVPDEEGRVLAEVVMERADEVPDHEDDDRER